MLVSGDRHRVPDREQVRSSSPGPSGERRQRVPDHPGRLRQVLHLLCRTTRAALSRAGPSLQSCTRLALVASGARQVTLLGQNVNAYHGDGDAGGTWDLARLLRELAEIPGLRAAALHDVPSSRHGRRSDLRSPRSAATHAVPAPARAIGLRCGGGDEPQYTATTTAASWTRCAPRGPIWRCLGLHRRLPGETKPTSRQPCVW